MNNNLLKLFDDSPFIIHQDRFALRENRQISTNVNKVKKRKFSFQHIDITYPMRKTGTFEFPVIKPYNGTIPSVFTPYDHHK